MAERDDNWQIVSKFVSDLRNASRLGTYVDSVVEVYESTAWRRYTDATGRSDEWRPCEFDYFLIACGADYTDVQRLLTWDRAKAANLATAMESDEEAERRPLTEASAAWQSPTGVPLAEMADKQGWTKAGGRLRVPPAPQRARTEARTGMTREEHARQVRESKIAPDRRQALDDLAGAAIDGTEDELELRYLLDVLRDRLRELRKSPSTGSGD